MLVQRCTLKTTSVVDVTGVDSLFDYDYMGAAEYEFGSLGKSLRRIVPRCAEYEIVDTCHRFQGGAWLMVFCEKTKRADALRDIADIVTRKIRTQEGSYLPEVLAGQDPSFYCTEAWWAIDDDWIAFRGAERAPLIFAAIEAVANRWATKNAPETKKAHRPKPVGANRM